jgi:hypothetical protein
MEISIPIPKRKKKWLNGDSKTSNFKTKSEKVENLLGSYNLLEKKMRKSSKEKKNYWYNNDFIPKPRSFTRG